MKSYRDLFGTPQKLNEDLFDDWGKSLWDKTKSGIGAKAKSIWDENPFFKGLRRKISGAKKRLGSAIKNNRYTRGALRSVGMGKEADEMYDKKQDEAKTREDEKKLTGLSDEERTIAKEELETERGEKKEIKTQAIKRKREIAKAKSPAEKKAITKKHQQEDFIKSEEASEEEAKSKANTAGGKIATRLKELRTSRNDAQAKFSQMEKEIRRLKGDQNKQKRQKLQLAQKPMRATIIKLNAQIKKIEHLESYGLLSYDMFITEAKKEKEKKGNDKDESEKDVDTEENKDFNSEDDILPEKEIKAMKEIMKEYEKKNLSSEDEEQLSQIKDVIKLHDLAVSQKENPKDNDDIDKDEEDEETTKDDNTKDEKETDSKEKKSFDDFKGKDKETDAEEKSETDESEETDDEIETDIEGAEENADDELPPEGEDELPEEEEIEIDPKKIDYSEKLATVLDLLRDFGYNGFDYKIKGNQNIIIIDSILDKEVIDGIKKMTVDFDINFEMKKEKEGEIEITQLFFNNKMEYKDFIDKWTEKEKEKKEKEAGLGAEMPPM